MKIKIRPKKKESEIMQITEEKQTEDKLILDNNIQDVKQDKLFNPNKTVEVVDLDLQDLSNASDLDKAISSLKSKDNLEMNTEVSDNEGKLLSQIITYSKKYGFKELDDLAIKNLELRVSKKRGGRKELVQMLQAERQHKEHLMGLGQERIMRER